MVGHGHQAQHLLVTQAGAQALQQARQAFGLGGAGGEKLAVGHGAGGELAAVQMQVQRGRDEFQPHQSFAQQVLQVREFHGGFGQFDAQLGRRVRGVARLLVQHAQREGGHARLARLRPGHQPRQQHAGAVQHLVGRVGTGKKLQPAVEADGQFQPAARVRAVAQGPVQVVQQVLPKAPRQAGARQRAQVAQALQAHPLQRFPVLAARAQHPHRGLEQQRLQRTQVRGVSAQHKVAAITAFARMPLRQQRRTQGRGRSGHLHAVAQRSDGVQHTLAQRCSTAKEAQAGLHFQQHGVRTLQRDGGCEGQRRVHDSLQRRGLAAGVAVGHQQVGGQRQRGVALDAGAQAALGRGGVDLGDMLIGDQRHRARGFSRGQRGAEGLQRQQRQVQSEPEHGHQSPCNQSPRAWGCLRSRQGVVEGVEVLAFGDADVQPAFQAQQRIGAGIGHHGDGELLAAACNVCP